MGFSGLHGTAGCKFPKSEAHRGLCFSSDSTKATSFKLILAFTAGWQGPNKAESRKGLPKVVSLSPDLDFLRTGSLGERVGEEGSAAVTGKKEDLDRWKFVKGRIGFGRCRRTVLFGDDAIERGI